MKNILKSFYDFFALTDDFCVWAMKILRNICIFIGLSYAGIFFSKEIKKWKKTLDPKGDRDIIKKHGK